MFENICIIGCGLIGSSILRAINKKNLCKKVSVYDKSKDVTAFIKQENLCKDLSNDISRLTREMDNVQKLVNIDLAKKRNLYAVFNIYLSIISLSLSFGSFIGSMFGMNLRNNFEKSNLAFTLAFILSLLIILISISLQILYFRNLINI